jgi:hypothetical protein
MSKYLEVILNELIISMTFTPICFFGQLLSDDYLFAKGTFKVGKFYFHSRVLFLTQNFIRSCVIHSNFFPTHSYMFFQRKTFQMRIQDFRFFIPPANPDLGRLRSGLFRSGKVRGALAGRVGCMCCLCLISCLPFLLGGIWVNRLYIISVE